MMGSWRAGEWPQRGPRSSRLRWLPCLRSCLVARWCVAVWVPVGLELEPVGSDQRKVGGRDEEGLFHTGVDWSGRLRTLMRSAELECGSHNVTGREACRGRRNLGLGRRHIQDGPGRALAGEVIGPELLVDLGGFLGGPGYRSVRDSAF